MIAIYVRQSIDKKDSISIDSQIEYCKKAVDDLDDYKIYSDKGFSGGNIKRPAFEKMLAHVSQGKIKKIIVYKLDRISRSITDFASIITTLGKYDTDFVSATEKFDTSTPMGRAMVYIIMIFAQLERETIAQRVKDNYYARGSKGYFMGGPAPFGFNKHRLIHNGKEVSTLIPNEDMAIVKNIFYMYSDSTKNMSLATLQKNLMKENLLPKDHTPWTTLKISRILHGTAYVKADAQIYTYFKNKNCQLTNDLQDFDGSKGCFLYGGSRKNGAPKITGDLTGQFLSLGLHQGIIPSKTWLLCQEKLSRNKQIKNSGRGKHSWLSGLTKCGYCGYAMTISLYKDTRYFHCRGRNHYKNCPEENHRTHYVTEIEDYISVEIQKRLQKLDLSLYQSSLPIENDTNQVQLDIIHIDEQIQNLLNELAEANTVVKGYINEKITTLDLEKQNLLDTLKGNQENTNNVLQQLELQENNIKDWALYTMEDKKIIAKHLIHKINITNTSIEIIWVY